MLPSLIGVGIQASGYVGVEIIDFFRIHGDS
jgi:hypothetical protein